MIAVKQLFYGFAAALCLLIGLSGCNASAQPVSPAPDDSTPPPAPTKQTLEISQITEWESGFSSASFSGDDGFEAFLAQGGASSDADVTQFLMSKLLADVTVNGSAFGCSTLTVGSPDGHQLFGRNFDWQACDSLAVTSKPTEGYASISTVNLGFISQAGGSLKQLLKQNGVRVLAALYAPLDGMNEKGLAAELVNRLQRIQSVDKALEKMRKAGFDTDGLLDRFAKLGISPIPLRKNFCAQSLPGPVELLRRISGGEMSVEYTKVKYK